MEVLRAVSLDLAGIDEKMSCVDGFPPLEYIGREHSATAVRVMSERDKAVVQEQREDIGILEVSAAPSCSRGVINRTPSDDREAAPFLIVNGSSSGEDGR